MPLYCGSSADRDTPRAQQGSYLLEDLFICAGGHVIHHISIYRNYHEPKVTKCYLHGSLQLTQRGVTINVMYIPSDHMNHNITNR